MNTEEKVAAALAASQTTTDLLKSIQADLANQSAVISVHAGDSLPLVLANAPSDAVLLIDTGFVHSGDLDFLKPVRLVGGSLIGAMNALAPHVRFSGVAMTGRNRDQTILTCGPATEVEECTLTGTTQGQARGILVNAADCVIRRTNIRNIWHSNDAQAIAGWSGTKNLLVEDCANLEASGEIVLFGGADAENDAAIPCDITIRRCYLSMPLAWRTLANCTCKTLFELKAARRVLVEDCTMENSFVDGQDGYGALLTVRNQYGAAPWSTIEDVTMRRVSGHRQKTSQSTRPEVKPKK